MLHGMIPAAFFATLLRRYLDSLLESPEYTASTSSTMTCLGTSAAVATAGIAIYGFVNWTKDPSTTDKTTKKQEEPKEKCSATIAQAPPEKSERCPRSRRKRSKSVVRKRKSKGKQWFLKNMRHYKSKYGRTIGKLMNQLLGIPFTEPSSDLVNSEDSEEETPTEVFKNQSFTDDITDSDIRDPVQHNTPAKTMSGKVTPKVEVASKTIFDDDDDDMEVAEEAQRRSSSLDLKDLLRENFKRQSIKKNKETNTSRSVSSSGSQVSTSSQKSGTVTKSSSTRSEFNSKRRRSTSDNRHICRHKNNNRTFTKKRNVTKKTRSGKCYHKMMF